MVVWQLSFESEDGGNESCWYATKSEAEAERRERINDGDFYNIEVIKHIVSNRKELVLLMNTFGYAQNG